MPWQMQGGQHRHVYLCRLWPKASGLIVDQIKSSSLLRTRPDKLYHFLLVFTIAAFEIIRQGATLAGNKQLTTDSRPRGCRNRGARATPGHLTFQCPQNLFCPAGALIRDSQERISYVKNPEVS